MIITPISPLSRLVLLNTKLDYKYNNTLSFKNEQEQRTYFYTCRVPDIDNEFTNIQPVRNNTVKILVNYDKLYRVNYVMYKNANFEDKWFYAFVVGRKYVNANITELTLEIDAFQTYMFDYKMKPSYIIRQTVDNDPLGYDSKTGESVNRNQDNLQLGDYVTCDRHALAKNQLNDEMKPVIWAGDYPSTIGDFAYVVAGNFSGRAYNGLYCIIPKYGEGVTTTDSELLTNLLNVFAEEQKVDSIVNIQLLMQSQIDIIKQGNNNIGDNMPDLGDITLDNLASVKNAGNVFDGYKPKNNKLYSYPYIYFEIDNMQGQRQAYNFEDFYDISDIQFSLKADVTNNPSIAMIPIDYRRTDSDNKFNLGFENWDYGISINNFPTCSYVTDYYKAWLAQQGGIEYLQGTYNRQQNYLQESTTLNNKQAFWGGVGSVANSVTQGIVGAVTSPSVIGSLGAGVGALTSAVSSGMETYYDIKLNNLQESNQYEQNEADYNKMLTVAQRQGDVPNVGNSNLKATNDVFTFFYQIKSIRYQYAKMIDDYFSKYGYPIKELKEVKTNNRKNWDFIKVNDLNIYGDLPEEEKATIKSIYQSGVTIWHNPSTMLDYSQDNPIV